MYHFSPKDQLLLRWLRQLLAILFALQLLAFAPDLASFYGPAAWIDLPLLTLQEHTIMMPIAQIIGYICRLLAITAAQGCYLLIALYLDLCALWAFGPGLARRMALALLLLLHLALFNAIPVYSYGLDYVSTSLLFYALLAPSRPNRYCLHYILTLQLHLCIIYFFAGLGKALGPNWWNGEALWKALNLPYFNQFFQWDILGLAGYPYLFVVGGWIIILLELLYPLAIYRKALHHGWLYAIMLMHMGIGVFMNLFGFALLMIAWNAGAFLVGNYILEKYYLKNKQNVSPKPPAAGSRCPDPKPVA